MEAFANGGEDNEMGKHAEVVAHMVDKLLFASADLLGSLPNLDWAVAAPWVGDPDGITGKPHPMLERAVELGGLDWGMAAEAYHINEADAILWNSANALHSTDITDWTKMPEARRLCYIR